MPVLASPDVIDAIVDDLRTKSAQLGDVQAQISAHAGALMWEGAGVERFHTQVDHADKGFNHCLDVYQQVFVLLDRAVTELTQARNALVRAEDFVMNEATKHSEHLASFFHHLGWTQYPALPARYSTEWEEMAIRAGYRP